MDEDRPPTEDLGSTERAVPGLPIRPERIGPYRLLQKIGEGGMGEVYEAEQEKPVRRKVALKIIKPGMDSKQVLARFEAERQALALMNHPNVARVFDAGADDRGRPYFAMEYVKGVRITEHCDRQRLTTHERLELFQQVCAGVQHAHQKGIIHRDIKPSNVLVQVSEGDRVPKIIDFGVAKATAQRLTERTLFTELGALIGTPEYMSPEQAEMTAEDIDTRTDVYSLGVLLYEMLVGALPFDSKELRQLGFDEIRRRIREDDPSKPSTRLNTLGDASSESAKRRRTDLRTLKRQLSGDLDWITMRALEKDRARRYGSPSDLADDIRRHLRHEPVVAGPPNALYRAGKFVRRHRVGVGATALVLGVLVAFAVTTTVQSRRIAREAETSEKVSEFLADMLGNMDPQALGLALWKDQRERVAEVRRTRGATEDEIEAVLASLRDAMSGVNATDVALRMVDEQILSRAAETIEQELAEEPRIAGQLEHTIGVTYRKLGLYEQAERHAKRAVAIRERELGRDHPDALDSSHELASVHSLQGRYDEAEQLFLETIEARKRVLGDDHANTFNSMNNLANAYRGQGRYDEAEQLYIETLEARKRVLGDDHLDTLISMNSLANVYQDQGRYGEAEALYLRIVEAQRRVLGDEHPATLNSTNNLANAYRSQGRYDEGEALLLESLETQKRVLGDGHPETLNTLTTLAILYSTQGRYDEAEPLYRETLDTRKRVLGDDHPRTLGALNNLATLYLDQGQYDEAEPLFLAALEIQERVLGADHPETAITMINLACLYRDTGSYERSQAFFERTLKVDAKAMGPDSVFVAEDLEQYAELLRKAGKDKEAAALEFRAESIREKLAGKNGKDDLTPRSP